MSSSRPEGAGDTSSTAVSSGGGASSGCEQAAIVRRMTGAASRWSMKFCRANGQGGKDDEAPRFLQAGYFPPLRRGGLLASRVFVPRFRLA